MSPTIKLSDNRSTVGLIPGDFSLPQPQRSIINLDFAKYLRTIWRAEQVKPVVFPCHHLVVGIKNTPQSIRSQICSIYTWDLKLWTFTSRLHNHRPFSFCSSFTAKSTISWFTFSSRKFPTSGGTNCVVAMEDMRTVNMKFFIIISGLRILQWERTVFYSLFSLVLYFKTQLFIFWFLISFKIFSLLNHDWVLIING